VADEFYGCSDPDCDAITMVRSWRARVDEPAGSTHGDGCSRCGEQLADEPTDGPEPDYEAMAEAKAMHHEPDEAWLEGYRR
jgi:hypothetical protein